MNGVGILKYERSGVVTRKSVVQAFEDALIAAGAPPYAAKAIAEANVTRAVYGDADVDTSMASIMNADGRQMLEARLLANGVSDSVVKRIMQTFDTLAEEKGTAGFAKHRNDLDLDVQVKTEDGSDLRLVDLLDHDIPTILDRYRRGVAGSAALARKGIDSRAARQEIIEAMQAEQRALGEKPLDADFINAVFSEFDAGPSWGYSNGQLTKGIGAPLAIAKGVANLSLLNKLGFAQLAEEGSRMAALGLVSWAKHNAAMIGLDKAMRDNMKTHLNDLSFMMGDIGHDQWMFRAHRELDEVNLYDQSEWMKGIHRAMGNMQFIQGYTSMFNTVRTLQQQMTAAGVSSKLFVQLRDGLKNPMTDAERKRIEFDLGIDEDTLGKLEALVQNGTVHFAKSGSLEYVNRLHAHTWDPILRERFASIMMRAQSQIIQKSLAGESSRWMHSVAASVLMQFKSFPMQAFSKQAMRNARFMDKQAAGSLLFGMSSAYVALALRDFVDGNDRTMEERAKQAFSYSNLTGWIPMTIDPVATILGLDDLRFSSYGTKWEATLPALDTFNRLSSAGPAALRKLSGQELSKDDREAFMAIPFMRTIGLKNLVDGE